MTYKEAHEYLDSLLVFGIKLGLENMHALCDLLDSPHEKLKFIHVAGTNGKGSTCSMLAASMKNCGLKTGFYSSPFLYRFTERFRVDGLEVSEDSITKAIEKISSLEKQLMLKTGVKPTYFEVVTAAAMLIFIEYNVDVVVWETGMGGRLDATNVVTPLISIITNIELDHTQYLGDTLEKIAFEKGGIVKKGIPFVCGDTKERVIDYYNELSAERQSPFILRGRDFNFDYSQVKKNESYYRDLKYDSGKNNLELKVPTLSSYQCENAALAIAALEILCDSLNLYIDLALCGLEKFIWPGRMEVREDGLILDGAHNPGGARTLVETLREIDPDKKYHFICGILADKDWQEVLDVLSTAASDFYFVEMENVRTSQADLLEKYAKEKGCSVTGCGSSKEAIEAIKRPADTVVVGSLYLIGEVLAILNDGKAAPIDSL